MHDNIPALNQSSPLVKSEYRERPRSLSWYLHSWTDSREHYLAEPDASWWSHARQRHQIRPSVLLHALRMLLDTVQGEVGIVWCRRLLSVEHFPEKGTLTATKAHEWFERPAVTLVAYGLVDDLGYTSREDSGPFGAWSASVSSMGALSRVAPWMPQVHQFRLTDLGRSVREHWTETKLDGTPRARCSDCESFTEYCDCI